MDVVVWIATLTNKPLDGESIRADGVWDIRYLLIGIERACSPERLLLLQHLLRLVCIYSLLEIVGVLCLSPFDLCLLVPLHVSQQLRSVVKLL